MGGATVVTALVAAAMVLSLALVVLAELYCTLLLRKRHTPNSAPTAINAAPRHPISAPSLLSFYTQGVIRTPRTYLFHNQLHHQQWASPESSTTDDLDQLMYICNPTYDKIMVTQFETPATSPSHFEMDIDMGNSSDGGSSSPPVAPMMKLPAENASLSLGGGPSTPGDSNTLDGGVTSSSSASASPPPSW